MEAAFAVSVLPWRRDAFTPNVPSSLVLRSPRNHTHCHTTLLLIGISAAGLTSIQVAEPIRKQQRWGSSKMSELPAATGTWTHRKRLFKIEVQSLSQTTAALFKNAFVMIAWNHFLLHSYWAHEYELHIIIDLNFLFWLKQLKTKEYLPVTCPSQMSTCVWW